MNSIADMQEQAQGVRTALARVETARRIKSEFEAQKTDIRDCLSGEAKAKKRSYPLRAAAQTEMHSLGLKITECQTNFYLAVEFLRDELISAGEERAHGWSIAQLIGAAEQLLEESPS